MNEGRQYSGLVGGGVLRVVLQEPADGEQDQSARSGFLGETRRHGNPARGVLEVP
ncbi:hypothetical protein ABZ370_41460 [Streptomyces sp. NPDC005962]|uniref:hypothetical protein n=1 Tax=Streptomyces sp. NPDC005962 TaxID=3154466 RepID=UPI0033D5DDDD